MARARSNPYDIFLSGAQEPAVKAACDRLSGSNGLVMAVRPVGTEVGSFHVRFGKEGGKKLLPADIQAAKAALKKAGKVEIAEEALPNPLVLAGRGRSVQAFEHWRAERGSAQVGDRAGHGLSESGFCDEFLLRECPGSGRRGFGRYLLPKP